MARFVSSVESASAASVASVAASTSSISPISTSTAPTSPTYNFKVIDSYKSRTIFTWICSFDVPLFHSNCPFSTNPSIQVVAKITKLASRVSPTENKPLFSENDRIVTFLQGGPGFPAETPTSKSGFLSFLLDKGYTVVNYDQRGTGLSTPLDYNSLLKIGEKLGLGSDIGSQQYVKLLSAFRADSIVKDCETIRKSLFSFDHSKKWSIQGQSYGGFCCHSYMSLYPDSLEEVIMTGGIPGIGLGVDDVYRATYKRTIQRNAHYYVKYPQDIKRVKLIVQHLSENKVILPNGGTLSVERFQQIGLSFGGSSGTDRVHLLVVQMAQELSLFQNFTYNTLKTVQDFLGFESNVLYALFQEAIYMDGPGHSSNWSADRLRYLPENAPFFAYKHKKLDEQWINDDSQVFFTGEMVFKSMFDDYFELKKFKKLAHLLHSFENWDPLYDKVMLSKVFDSYESYQQKKLMNPELGIHKDDVKIIKVVAAVYFNDQYVDFDLSKHTIDNVMGKIRPYVTSEYFHNGLGVDSAGVMSRLFGLLEQEVD